MSKKRIHTVTFVSDRGKVWQIDYTMEDRDTVGELTEVRIDGTRYHINSYRLENALLEQAAKHGCDVYENAYTDNLEARDNQHMID